MSARVLQIHRASEATAPAAVRPAGSSREAPALVRYGAYPAVCVATCAGAMIAVERGWNLDLAFIATAALLYAGIAAAESAWPYRIDWQMNRLGVVRDLKYAGLTLSAGFVVSVVAGLVTVRMSAGSHGLLSGAPLAATVPAGLLVYELANYAHHRLSHWGEGRVGGFLWRVHAVHHVPDRMNGLMTLAGHPINVIVQRITVSTIPIYVLGLGPDAVFLLNVIVLLVGTVSHWNVDSRLGPFNYVLIGPEVHRWHHDAEPGSAGNFGTVLSIYDVLFGTLRFRPVESPARIGPWEPELYPSSYDVAGQVAFAFRGDAARDVED